MLSEARRMVFLVQLTQNKHPKILNHLNLRKILGDLQLRKGTVNL